MRKNESQTNGSKSERKGILIDFCILVLFLLNQTKKLRNSRSWYNTYNVTNCSISPSRNRKERIWEQRINVNLSSSSAPSVCVIHATDAGTEARDGGGMGC